MNKENEIEEFDDDITFNYSDIFFSCYYDGEGSCCHQSRDHALIYVYSGEMVVDDGKNRIKIRKGESVFVRRDHRITLYKKRLGKEPYFSVFLLFTRKFLREMWQKLEIDKVPKNRSKLKPSVIKLPISMEIESLFCSIPPYFNQTAKVNDDFMHLKFQEGLIALRHIDARFLPTLCDFTEPWKIDILDFMNQNYMYEFSLEDLANFTGRSLATFKRDFKKISDLTPQRWLIRKRLEVAYGKMKEGNSKVQDVYVEVGFKNPSHFTTAFKKQYGIPPTAASQYNLVEVI